MLSCIFPPSLTKRLETLQMSDICVDMEISHFYFWGNINISNIRNLRQFMCLCTYLQEKKLPQLLFKIKEKQKFITVPQR